MNTGLKGFPRIFSFTFSQQVRKKGYRNATIIVALLCLLIPIIVMSLVEVIGSDKSDVSPSISCNANEIFVIDRSSEPVEDLSFLNDLGIEGYSHFSYVNFGSNEDKALQQAGDLTLLLIIDRSDWGYSINVILPEKTALNIDDAEAYRRFIYSNFQFVLIKKSGVDLSQVTELAVPVEIEVAARAENAQPASGSDVAKEIMAIAIPYLNIMVLYFMILLYGQGVANSVIMEKTSNLMDTFLVAVKPAAMVMGKVLAIALSGLMQLAIWIAGLIGGFAAGTHIVKLIDPNTEMGLIKLFGSLSIFSGMFSLPTIFIALLIVIAGFLLYCSLAAIGGSMASKPEDLSSTNMLFTLALVISFFCSIYAGGMVNVLSSSEQWLNWFPLTAILVTPSRVLLGDISIAAALGSLAIVLMCSFAFVLLAGKIYSMLSLYKGNPPSIAKVIGMLRSNKN
ncbi:MAG: ABC transporter permease [Eubacteriales bacterium]